MVNKDKCTDLDSNENQLTNLTNTKHDNNQQLTD
jgi:hypothetical protein